MVLTNLSPVGNAVQATALQPFRKRVKLGAKQRLSVSHFWRILLQRSRGCGNMELMPDYATRVIGFADFQLDIRAGELRRAGSIVRLQNQPFRILSMLL